MIAVDWGTTSLRAFRLDAAGGIRDVRRAAQGILAAAGRFEAVLAQTLDGWDDRRIVMSGMIGSRQGWREVPYVACPAGLAGIARGMLALDASGAFSGRSLWLVPGLAVHDGERRDVMRGEETQLCGLIDTLGVGSHTVLLPGTHSKHAIVRDRRIVDFRTAMTGELYDVLCRHSILGRLMAADAAHDDAAFASGVRAATDASAGGDAGLLSQLFTVRTKGLFGDLPETALASYLSGLLIGHELRMLPPDATPVHLVGAQALLARYAQALGCLGRETVMHDDSLGARGLHALAAERGLP